MTMTTSTSQLLAYSSTSQPSSTADSLSGASVSHKGAVAAALVGVIAIVLIATGIALLYRRAKRKLSNPDPEKNLLL